MSQADNKAADIPANDLRHVDLWIYFESRGAGVKDTMFNVVTWIVGFAAVILGFAITEFLSIQDDAITVQSPSLLLALDVIGLMIVFYALVLINDFSKHINRNFDRADRARNTANSLLKILDIEDRDPSRTQETPPICKYLFRVVWMLGAIYLAIGILAVLQF